MLKDKQAIKRTQEFTWFTAEGYVYRVAGNFTMMEKIIKDFYNVETLIKLFNSQSQKTSEERL